MVYNREKFIPQVSDTMMRIPFNEEIMGYILVSPQISENALFFSSVSRRVFNKSLRRINFAIQRHYIKKKELQSKVYFQNDIKLNYVISFILLIIYLSFFFVLDKQIVDTTISLRDNLWIAILVLQILVFVMFVYFMVVFFHKREVYDFETHAHDDVKQIIEEEKGYYQNQGYQWKYVKKAEQNTYLIRIDRNFQLILVNLKKRRGPKKYNSIKLFQIFINQFFRQKMVKQFQQTILIMMNSSKQEKHTRQNYFIKKENERLRGIRLYKKNCLNLIGFPEGLANTEVLVQKQFLGQYGKIKKIYVQSNVIENQMQQKMIYSVYVTYQKIQDASKALICLNGFQINKTKLKASYGITRYCLRFLKSQQCQIKDCAFLHHYVDPSEYLNKHSFKRAQKMKSMNNKNIFQDLIISNFDFRKLFSNDENDKNYKFFPDKIYLRKKFLKFLRKQQYAFFQSRNIQLDAFNTQYFSHLFWQNFFYENLQAQVRKQNVNPSAFFLTQTQLNNIQNLFGKMIEITSTSVQSNKQRQLKKHDKFFQKQINQDQSKPYVNQNLLDFKKKQLQEQVDINQIEDFINYRTKAAKISQKTKIEKQDNLEKFINVPKIQQLDYQNHK